jgi:sortase A
VLSQKALEAEAAAGSGATGAGGRPMPSGAVALLIIPKIDLKAYVGQGTDQDVLANGPGHYEETPLPGAKGNAAIAAHRTMHGHPFRRLDELKRGDRIVTYTKARKATYRVVEIKRVDPSDVSVIEPKGDNRLTLTTCNPVGSARQRLIVVARLAQ